MLVMWPSAWRWRRQLAALTTNIANALNSLKRHEQARQRYDQALSLFRARGPSLTSQEEARALAATLLGAGGCCYSLQDYDAAERHYRQLQAMLPDQHPYLLGCRTGLASIQGRRGRWVGGQTQSGIRQSCSAG